MRRCGQESGGWWLWLLICTRRSFEERSVQYSATKRTDKLKILLNSAQEKRAQKWVFFTKYRI